MTRTFRGLIVGTNPTLLRRVEDWSGCRSPSRARRRLRMGHPQRMVVRYLPMGIVYGGQLMVHPEILEQMEKAAADHSRHLWDSRIF